MARFVRYEYGGGAVEYRRTPWLRWAVICLVLFGIGVSAPRVLQQQGLLFQPKEQINHAPSETPGIALQQPVEDAEKEAETTAIVDTQLQKIIEQWAKRNSNQTWGISVETISDTPTVAQHQPLQRFQPGSLYSLLLTHTLSERISSDQWTKRKVYDYRGAHTYLECADLMLRENDAACSEAVGNALGWSGVDGRLTALGLQNTKLGIASNRFTTAGDTSKYMHIISEEKALSSGARQSVLDSLKASKSRQGIPAGTKFCEVYNKVGEAPNFVHDVALVECGKKKYVLSIMSQGGTFNQIADLARIVNNYHIAQ